MAIIGRIRKRAGIAVAIIAIVSPCFKNAGIIILSFLSLKINRFSLAFKLSFFDLIFLNQFCLR
jgi:hypothetical protein